VAELDAQLSAWLNGFGWPLTGLARLLFAAVCGGLVGLEREVRGRQAGFRTYTLVCVGCAIAMLVSVRIAFLDLPNDNTIQLDPARIAYGVMAGIGFLGGGVIIRHGTTVRGLTTAAGIWCVAGVGLAAGMGLYIFALMGAVVAFATLWILDWVEHLLPRTHYRTVLLRRQWDDHCVSRTVNALRAAGYKVPNWSFERVGDLQEVRIRLVVGFARKEEFDKLETDLPEHHGLDLIAVEDG